MLVNIVDSFFRKKVYLLPYFLTSFLPYFSLLNTILGAQNCKKNCYTKIQQNAIRFDYNSFKKGK